jgi:competence protein ComEC
VEPPGQNPEPLEVFARPSEQPVFYAAVAYSLGIIWGAHAVSPMKLWLFAFLLVLLYSLYCCRDRVRVSFFATLATLVLLGAIHVQLEQRPSDNAPDLSRFTSDDKVTVIAHVTRIGLLRESGGFAFREGDNRRERRQTIDVETEQIVYSQDDTERSTPVEIGIRINAHSQLTDDADNSEPTDSAEDAQQSDTPVFLYGDRIQFTVKLREPRNYGNPGAMDYRGYLRDIGIVALGSVKASRVERLPGFFGTRLGHWRSRMRRSLINHMIGLANAKKTSESGSLFSMSKEEAGVLAAMIIGEQSLLQRDTRTDFQRTGTYHILVVSGMNVGILAFVIFWLCKRLRASESMATAATILLSLLYAYMTDLGSPIVRAALMLSLYLAARLLYRDKFSLNSIGTAALLMLIAGPRTLFEASFQLTFLSVVVLGGIVQPLLERTTEPYKKATSAIGITGYDATLPPKLAQFRLDLRMISGRLARLYSLSWMKFFVPSSFDAEVWRLRISTSVVVGAGRVVIAILNLVTVTTIVQVGLALPMIVYFHRMAMLGLPSNMVVVPLTAVLMPIGIAATLLSYVSPSVAALPTALTAVTLHGITATVRQLGGVHFADVRLAMPSMAITLIAAAAFVFAMFMVRNKRFAIVALGLLGLFLAGFVLILPPAPQLRSGVVEMTAIDVGQGDSILVVSPDGRTVLIDGGGPVGGMHSDSFDIGEDVVSPYLWSRGITRLDAIALTHAHSDHLSGLHSVMANFKPRELWVGINPQTAAYRGLLKQAAEQGVVIVHHIAPESFSFGTLNVHVLAPAADYVPLAQAKNDDSLVMEVSYGATSAVLAGDAEKKVERKIATQVHHADLLKVAHHGSATSTTPEFLEAVHPQFAVISVGYHSIYGHPKPAVLARLMAARARTFRTDLQGAVTFYLDGKQVIPAVD